jgi:hypothetical protein
MKYAFLILLFFIRCTAIGQQKILIDHPNNKQLLLSEFVGESELIELKYPLGMLPQVVSKVFETKNHLLVFDSNSPTDKWVRRIAQFNKKGEFQKLVKYNDLMVYDDLNDIIYLPKGAAIEAYNAEGIKTDQINLERIDGIADQGFNSFVFYEKKIYFIHYIFYLKEKKAQFLLKAYDIDSKNMHIIYDETVEGLTVAFQSIHSVNKNQLIHHNPNLDKIISIDKDGEIAEHIVVEYKGFRPESRLRILFRYYFKADYLIGYYRTGNKGYSFVQDLRNQSLYTFNDEVIDGIPTYGIKDDIYNTGLLSLWNLNVVNKVYSIRYKHPDGSYGAYLPDSNPSVLMLKLK